MTTSCLAAQTEMFTMPKTQEGASSLPAWLIQMDEAYTRLLDATYRGMSEVRDEAVKVREIIGAEPYRSLNPFDGIYYPFKSIATEMGSIMLSHACQELGTTRSPFPFNEGEQAIVDARKEIKAELGNRTESLEAKAKAWARHRPSTVWQILERLYDPEVEAFNAAQRAAKKLRTLLGIKYANPVSTVGGKVRLSMNVYTHEWWSDKAKKITENQFEPYIEAWGIFADYAELDPASTEAMAKELSSYHYSSRSIESRHRARFVNGIDLVTFHSRFEFRFPEAIASKLNMFLSEYAEDQNHAA